MPHVPRLPPVSLLQPTPLALHRLLGRTTTQPVILVHDLVAALRAPPDNIALARLASLELRLPATARDAEPGLLCAGEGFAIELGAGEVEPLALAGRVVAADHFAVFGAEAVAEVLDGVGLGLGLEGDDGGRGVCWERRGLRGCRGGGGSWSWGWTLVRVERGLELFFAEGGFGGDGGREVGGVEIVGFEFVVLLFVGAGGVVVVEGRHYLCKAGNVGGCGLGGSHLGVLG